MREVEKSDGWEGDYHAFLLRLWREWSGSRWHATLERPQSGRRLAFGSIQALLEYLATLTETSSTTAQDRFGRLAEEQKPKGGRIALGTRTLTDKNRLDHQKETEMSETIMQLNFKYDVSAEDYLDAVAPLAEQFAALPGLRWKIWMINPEESEAGGIYMFEDDAALQNFLDGELAAAVTSHPALRDFSVKPFKVMEEQTAITRRPVHAVAG